MNNQLADRTMNRAALTFQWREFPLLRFDGRFKSRMIRLACVFAFGFLWGSGALGFALVQGPGLDPHAARVTALIMLGSFGLCSLSSVLLFLAVFGAYLSERISRIEAEQVNAELEEELACQEERYIACTSTVASRVMVRNLDNVEFREFLGGGFSDSEEGDGFDIDSISEKLFPKEEVMLAYEEVLVHD